MKNLTDRFQRQIEYLRLSITDRCNLRCKYCMPAAGLKDIPHQEILRYEEYLRIVKILVALGVKKIRLTGGEPTVRKGLVDFIQVLHHLDGVEDLALTTNGILLKKMARPLKQAGLQRLNVSLDSLRTERYREITRGGELDKCLEGIEAALMAGFTPVKLNIVIQNGFNTDEILDFARLTLEKPIHVRFIEYMSEEATQGKYFYSNDETFKVLNSLAPLEIAQDESGRGPARYFRYANAPGKIGLISPISHQFCSGCNRIRLTAEGKLLLCLGSDQYLDLRTPMRQGIADADLEALIVEAVHQKPSGHHFGTTGLARGMSSIGG